jgi:hypothetical protein
MVRSKVQRQEEYWKAIARAIHQETDHSRISELVRQLNEALRGHSWTSWRNGNQDRNNNK